MKLKNILVGIVSLAAIATSCQKEDTMSNPATSETTDFAAKNSGVAPDNPADLARVPMYASAEFLANGSYTSELASEPTSSTGVTYAGRGPRTTRDRTSPVINITSPASGASISGTVTISISASDNVGVTSVYLKINGSTFKNWVAAPYTTTWTPSADGSYTLTATAIDAAGNTSTHSIVVSKSTVIVVPPPPTTLPSSYLMATPPVMSQGGEGSCLTMALSAQRSIEKYYQTGATSYTASTNIVSPEFLYNQTKVSSGCGSGAAMLTSMNFLMNTGVCRWSLLPYSSANGCDASIVTSAMTSDAQNFRIPTYHSILATDLTGIKTSLASKHPVSFTFQMDANFYNAGPGYIWNSRGSLMYTHALVLVGYDDSKRAFKAQNGWGTTWGDQGFIWIDYDFFKTIVGYTYAMN